MRYSTKEKLIHTSGRSFQKGIFNVYFSGGQSTRCLKLLRTLVYRLLVLAEFVFTVNSHLQSPASSNMIGLNKYEAKEKNALLSLSAIRLTMSNLKSDL